MYCIECKNKSSEERCSAKALKGLQFCGRHAKVKKHKLWKDPNSKVIVSVQKLWRGYVIRKLIKLAGPGVLDKKVWHNTEELVTGEEQIHPFNYFAFEEAGKVYWFDYRSIFQWSIEHLTNPYTKQPLNIETSKRLRELVYLKEFHGCPIYHSPETQNVRSKIFIMRWVRICQILEEFLFIPIDPILFLGLSRLQVWNFTHLLKDSIYAWSTEHKSEASRRKMYAELIRKCYRKQTLEILTVTEVTYYLGETLLSILVDSKNPYDMCFHILSARYRL